MKYLKYGIGLIGACAIVSASVVAPFSYALSQKSMTDAINQIERTYWGSHPRPSQNFGYWTCIRLANYNSDNTVRVSYTDIVVCSNTRDNWNFAYSITYDDSSTTASYFEFQKFQWVTLNPNFDTEYVILFFDNRVIGVYGFNALNQSNTHSLILESSRFNEDAYYSDYSLPSKLEPLAVSGYNGGLTSLQDLGDLVDNPPSPPTEPTIPPYTDSAPGFPNLPDNWVNGGGDVDIKIDLPDVDFNLPDLPDYTLPSAPTIPEQFQTGISTVFGKIWDIVVQSGLVWLVVFSLTCSLIIYILSR